MISKNLFSFRGSLFLRALACGTVLSVLCSCLLLSARCEGIRREVLRLHILANSDSEEDQALKLRVRDRLLSDGSLLIDSASDEEEAANMIKDRIAVLQKSAEDEIACAGYDYPVAVTVEEDSFNTRVYENVTLPAGQYEAVRVVIGEGAGHNWWCVMFPPMCLPAAQDDTSLSDVLNKDEYDLVENADQYEVKFKVVEWYQTAREKISEWLQ